MHEASLMGGILDAVVLAAQDAGATKITEINLRIGDMTEVVSEALDFAFLALSEGTLAEGAKLSVEYVHPSSRCLDCGEEFEHDRYHLQCPKCSSWSTQLLTGREMYIDNIEVDID